MSTLSHPPTHVAEEKQPWAVQLLSREVLVVMAIGLMWLAVAVTAIWGADMNFSSNDGSNTTLPSVAAVALFAFLGTWAGFKHGFIHRND